MKAEINYFYKNCEKLLFFNFFLKNIALFCDFLLKMKFLNLKSQLKKSLSNCKI